MTSATDTLDGARIELLKQQLDDPRVAAALLSLMDHADLLAILVQGAGDLLSRSDAISKNLSHGIATLRDVGQATFKESLDEIDFAGVTTSLLGLGRSFADASPAIIRLVESDTISPAAIDVIAMTARSLVAGHQVAAEKNETIKVGTLVKAVRDEDVMRGMGFLIEVARSLGKALKDERAGKAGADAAAPTAGKDN